MNKAAVKNFAIWARNKLIADISYKAGLVGVTAKGISEPLPQSSNDVQFFDIGTTEPYSISGYEIIQRQQLVRIIQEKAKQSDYQTALTVVIEEVSYTWFNRLIAIRFMEVNDYLPSRMRVLSSENPAKTEPDLVTRPFDADLPFTATERELVLQLKIDNELDELFRYLFIKQCNELNKVLPELFEKTNDYTELLLNLSFTDKDGIVARLVDTSVLSEDNFKNQVQIIGWLYQYYNDERKNEVINIYKGTVKKEDIPAATQLFTTEWVVRYMVDNSLGRYWLERNPQSKLRDKLTYFVTPQQDMVYLEEKIEPQDLTVLDPCMGSGHILVYAFDVLMEIYRERGYSDSDAVVAILQNNLYGLDIDDRAYQLAYFAVMMKARSYNRRILSLGIKPHVLAIQESNGIQQFASKNITTDTEQNIIGDNLVKLFMHAKAIGSIQLVEEEDYEAFIKYLNVCEGKTPTDLEDLSWKQNILPRIYDLAKQADIMARKYAVVVTNPPYLNKMESHLKKFVTTEYRAYSSDLFSVFIYRNFDFCKPNGYSAFMTPFVWMFIKSYEKLREYIIDNKAITTLVQMEYSAFEEATVPICTFVLRNTGSTKKGLYIKLTEFQGGLRIQDEKLIQILSNPQSKYLFEVDIGFFNQLPSKQIAYWASPQVIWNFQQGVLVDDLLDVRQGLASGDNNRFLRFWFEVDRKEINYNAKSTEDFLRSGNLYAPHDKGGPYRKWFGNNDYVIKFNSENYSALSNMGNRLPSRSYYFREAISWSLITSANFSIRYRPIGSIPNVAGNSAFSGDYNLLLYLLALLNTPIADYLFKMMNPTLNLNVGDLKEFPVLSKRENTSKILQLSDKCIKLARADWNSSETSNEFYCNPLANFVAYKKAYLNELGIGDSVNNKPQNLSEAYALLKNFVNLQFNLLWQSEEHLNKIFIELYGFDNELEAKPPFKAITVRYIVDSEELICPYQRRNPYLMTQIDLVREFISYAVGCMFGRYSLDVDSLAYAGGDWDDSKYSTFIPDKDNILLITDEEYYKDDIVGLFVAFVKKVYGAETLEENLNFISNALGGRGDSSREIIRNYFLKDFFRDHCKTYKKRPIYWLFDSGRTNGFKALMYMHRYDENTIGNLRIDYLHQIQQVYTREISRMQETIDNSSNGREVAAAEKRKEKLTKQLKETTDYDEKISHLALARNSIDLDDGVKVNYEKVQTDADGNKLDVLAKIR